MAEIRLTKNELRAQQIKLVQLERYLPTLQLKKARLQQETQEAKIECIQRQETLAKHEKQLALEAPLLSEAPLYKPLEMVKIEKLEKRHENIAGVEISILEKVHFSSLSYSLIDSPIWLDAMIEQVRNYMIAQEELKVAQEKKEALERELRQVSIRVNLFEKVLIPKAKNNIKMIKVFLGDQALVSVGRAKVVKTKLSKRDSQDE
jgi:V/A-type H+-transporting ATPase subunit D